MPEGRTLIIGDIHGCLNMLKRLIDKIEWNPIEDRLIFIGDYIDRGEDGKGVIDYILQLKKDSPFIQCLIAFVCEIISIAIPIPISTPILFCSD